MPTNKPRTMITFNDQCLFEQVNSYRFDNRFKSQNDAIMDLIDRGIDIVMGKPTEKPVVELSEEETSMLAAYRAADDRARADAMRTLKEHPKKGVKT